MVGDSAGNLPETVGSKIIAVGDNLLAMSMTHAQDIDLKTFEYHRRLATATCHIRVFESLSDIPRRVLCEVVFDSPERRISVGDAQTWLHVQVPGAKTRIVVSAENTSPSGLTEVWIDLASYAG